MKQQKRHADVAVPIEYVNKGPEAVAAYLYVEALSRKEGTRPYVWVAAQLEIDRQVAKERVARFIAGEE